MCTLTFDLIAMTFMYGAQVWRWSKKVWAVLAAFAGITFSHIVLAAHNEGSSFATGHVREAVLLCCCETVKNITVAVPDAVYRDARIRAAERGTSISSLVSEYLCQMSTEVSEFDRLEAQQYQVQREIGSFQARDRMGRDEIHDRSVR